MGVVTSLGPSSITALYLLQDANLIEVIVIPDQVPEDIITTPIPVTTPAAVVVVPPTKETGPDCCNCWKILKVSADS